MGEEISTTSLSLLRTGWQPLKAPPRGGDFLCADFGLGPASASYEIGMSVALGRDAVPIGGYLAGSLLTLMCSPGRGCKRTADSSATVTRRCLRRPFLAPGPCVSDPATVTSFLCYLPEQRLGSHTHRKKPASKCPGWNVQGRSGLFSLGSGHFSSPVPRPGASSYHLFSSGGWSTSQQTALQSGISLAPHPHPPVPWPKWRISGLHASQGPFDWGYLDYGIVF